MVYHNLIANTSNKERFHSFTCFRITHAEQDKAHPFHVGTLTIRAIRSRRNTRPQWQQTLRAFRLSIHGSFIIGSLHNIIGRSAQYSRLSTADQTRFCFRHCEQRPTCRFNSFSCGVKPPDIFRCSSHALKNGMTYSVKW